MDFIPGQREAGATDRDGLSGSGKHSLEHKPVSHPAQREQCGVDGRSRAHPASSHVHTSAPVAPSARITISSLLQFPTGEVFPPGLSRRPRARHAILWGSVLPGPRTALLPAHRNHLLPAQHPIQGHVLLISVFRAPTQHTVGPQDAYCSTREWCYLGRPMCGQNPRGRVIYGVQVKARSYPFWVSISASLG